MGRTVIFGVLIVAAIVFAGIRYLDGKAPAVVFGEILSADFKVEENDAKVRFAELVERRLIEKLVSQFSIDTSDKSVEEFAAEDAPDLVTAEQTRKDQQNVAKIADALQSVVDGQYSVPEAHEMYALEEYVPMPDWVQLAGLNANEESIATMRTFASTSVTNVQNKSIESLRWIYVTRRIQEEICSIPEQKEQIDARIADIVGDDADLFIDESEGIFNFECVVQSNQYITARLADNVVVNNAALAGYTEYIMLLNPVVSHMTNQ